MADGLRLSLLWVGLEVVRYRSVSTGKGSVDEKLIVYGRGSFIKGAGRTRQCCNTITISVTTPTMTINNNNTATTLLILLSLLILIEQ